MAARSTSTKAKAAPVEETEDEFEEIEDAEETEDDDEDLEELEEVGEDDEEEDEAPKPKAKKTTTAKATTTKTGWGSAELAAYITETTGDKYDGRSIRMLLRKLAKDGKLERVVGETRDRYSFTGPNDPTVKAVLAMVKSGEAKAMKQEGLQAVKDKAAAKRAAAKKEAEEAEDVEEVEEAPKPRRTRAAAAKPAPAKATPAKATPATRRTRSASASS